MQAVFSFFVSSSRHSRAAEAPPETPPPKRARFDEPEEKAAETEEMQFIRKCDQVAESFFQHMLAMFTLPDGRLNNELEKARIFAEYWGMDQDEYPENLRLKAQELESEGQSSEAKKCLERAEKNEKKREDRLSKLQKTLFPVTFLDTSTRTTFDGAVQECTEELSRQSYFYGSNNKNPEDLASRMSSEHLRLACNEILDTGSGTYLRFNRAAAVRDGVNVLQVEIKPKLKIAIGDQKMDQVISSYFFRMAHRFIHQKEEAILEQVKPPEEQKFKLLSGVKFSLINRFTRHFYTEQGFRGVYRVGSTTQGNYLNLYYPKEDIVKISESAAS